MVQELRSEILGSHSGATEESHAAQQACLQITCLK